MQRASDLFAVYDALRQRPALVRALIVQSEHLIVRSTEHGDISCTILALDHSGSQARNILQTGYFYPITHDFSITIFLRNNQQINQYDID
jgi:hypothetical protein